MGRVRPARGRGHVVDIRYFINLGASGEEGSLSEQFSLICFPLHRFPPRVRDGRRTERTGGDRSLVVLYSTRPCPQLGSFWAILWSHRHCCQAASSTQVSLPVPQEGVPTPPHPTPSLWAPRAGPETSNRNSSWGLFPDRSLTGKVSPSFLAQSGQSKT